MTSHTQEKNRKVGNYTIGKTIGEGTFGKVKLGTHILTSEKVAIKILEKDRIVEQADVERVAREIHILKLLRHPNIIQLYEIIETPKQLYLIMEYANGGELFDYIVMKERIPEKEACQFFQQIMGGVEYLHRLRIVHRDLKPENLLLDHKKNIKIVDFGLSNIYKENESLKTACGSPCYAAPEMIAGKRYSGLNVDIWSCGVILYALICGYLPFEDANTNTLYKKIMNGVYEVPDFLSPEAKDMLHHILSTDPEKRFKINDIRKHVWFNIAKNEGNAEGIFVGKHRIPVDSGIVREMEKMGFDHDLVIQCVESNKHNNVSTTYYLLLRQFLEHGGKSAADISSNSFSPLNTMASTDFKGEFVESSEVYIPKTGKNYAGLITNLTSYSQTHAVKHEKSNTNNNNSNVNKSSITSTNNTNENTTTYPFQAAKKSEDLAKKKSSEVPKSEAPKSKDRGNRYENYDTNKAKTHVFNSKSPDYLSIYNTLSKNQKSNNENEGKYKANYFSTTDREKNEQNNVSFSQGSENPSKKNLEKINIYQTSNTPNVLPKSKEPNTMRSAIENTKPAKIDEAKNEDLIENPQNNEKTPKEINSPTAPKSFNGPFHLASVFPGDPHEILLRSIHVLEFLGIEFKSNGKFKFSCNKEFIRFEMELFRLGQNSMAYFFRLQRQKGDKKKFNKISSEILSLLNSTAET